MLGLTILVSVAGCYLSHDRAAETDAGGDAARPSDVGPRDAARPDAGPRDAGGVWVNEPRPALLVELSGVCRARLGATTIVHVTTPLQTACEVAGPATVERAADGTWVVTATVWVERIAPPGVEPCTPMAGISERDVAISIDAIDAEPVVVRDSVSGAEIVIEPNDEFAHACCACGARDTPCSLDCDCAPGLVCIPGVESPAECGRCGTLCDLLIHTHRADRLTAPDQECPRDESCRGDGTLVARHCVPREGDACLADPDCPAGQHCESDSDAFSACVWSPTMLHGRCEGDADCAPGLHCTETPAGPRCEALCFGARMGCPTGSTCAPETWTCAD